MLLFCFAQFLNCCCVVHHDSFQRAQPVPYIVDLRGAVIRLVQFFRNISILLCNKADFVVLLFYKHASATNFCLQLFLAGLSLWLGLGLAGFGAAVAVLCLYLAVVNPKYMGRRLWRTRPKKRNVRKLS